MSWQTPENLSADEIAVLLGFADAAAMVVAIGQYCVAGGTGDAITLTVPDWSGVDGAKLSFRASGGNSGAVTIAVNGGTARDLRKSSQDSGVGVLTGGELVGLHTVQWDAANSIFRLLNYRATREDVPYTLNATTFWGDITLNTSFGVRLDAAFGAAGDLSAAYAVRNVGADCATIQAEADTNYGAFWIFSTKANTGSGGAMTQRLKVGESATLSVPLAVASTVVSVGTSFTTICAVSGNQALLIATVTGTGSILLEWDGSALTKLAGVATLVVAGSAGAGETAFRVSGGNLQAIVDTGTRNVSSGFSVRH